ncbi:insulinase family protein, partial [Myxococcota bacterium]|nr:insulinase family protein [Myxococcota bacterium]
MDVIRKKLDNGLVVLSRENHAAPVVALQAWVKIGSADESEDIAGIAHVHEHMLFKGTQKRGVGEIAMDVESAGGEINAWTSFDQTVYHIVLAADELETGIDILSDALQNSAFDKEELGRELEVVLEEIRRSEDMPSRRVSRALFSSAYKKHPYRRPVIGYVDTVNKFTREGIVDFFQKNYRPSRIVFTAVGDFDSDELQTLVQKYFGKWDDAGVDQLPPREVEPAQEDLRLHILREDVKESHFTVAWHIPSISHEDIPAIDALSVLLGHGDSSRLFTEIRRRRDLVNDVYAYAFTPADAGLFMLGAGLRSENLREALKAMLCETYALSRRLVCEEELAKTKVQILSESAYQSETVQGLARRTGFMEVVAGSLDFGEQYN